MAVNCCPQLLVMFLNIGLIGTEVQLERNKYEVGGSWA